jgi:hypothetical protein
MAEHAIVTPTQTAFQRYAPSLFSFAVLVIGSLQTVTTVNLVVALQLVALAAGSAATLLVPLVGTTYRGKVKIALEILTAIIALVLPYAIEGRITREQGILVIVGALKILATHFGLAIRTDVKVAAPVTVVAPAATVGYVSVPTISSGAITAQHIDEGTITADTITSSTIGFADPDDSDPLPDPALDGDDSVDDIIAKAKAEAEDDDDAKPTA